ncbi:SDR family NAD(P)-dependent oxidoreductase [Fluviibacterium sp. DFM31]|uniref:SDR family NAD(P)-dependent oxidoreductase n=1 Tax=Meridianimarinicoccus marinus TaxID=3231483 RepID=A0ABV3L4W1_9RHOB
MQRALVIGSSGGIGGALTDALRTRLGAGLVATLSRRDDGLDITSETAVKDCLSRQEGPFDLIFLATGGLEVAGHPPEKALREVTPAALRAQFDLNTLGPALVMKHALPLLPKDRRAVFAALSARVGSIGDNRLGGWHSYRASKAALNQILRGAAIELRRSHPQAICLALHPGTVATPLTRAYASRHPTVAPEDAARNLLTVVDGLAPDDSGGFFDWAGKTIPW